MRTKTIARFRRAALAGALAVSLAAGAQQEQSAQPAQEAQPAARPETAPVVTEQGPRPPPDNTIQPVPGAPEEYVIQKGDTLWDLSQKFLNNPWYWPKIWSNNPYIENPHWIYPGNKLRIVPGEGGQQAPAQVQTPPEQPPGAETASAPAEEPPATAEAPPPAPAPDLEVVNKSSKEMSNAVSVSGKLAFTPPPVGSMMLAGLMSWCTMPARWATASACATCRAIPTASCTARGRFSRSRSVTPSTYSIAMYARSPSAPAS